jgi:hypothetical protein
MFGKWRRRRDFDLSSVDVPRLAGDGEVIVERLAPMVPFLLDHDGAPTVIVPLDGLPAAEVEALAAAVRANRCVLIAAYRLYSTYPVLIFSLFVYDTPDGPPLSLEGYRDVTSADVQDFVVRLGREEGRGRVLLYGGEPRRLLAEGEFVLRIPPFITPALPHRTSRTELKMLWLIFAIAAQQRARIAPEDFKAAVDAHMAREPNLTARSDPTGP